MFFYHGFKEKIFLVPWQKWCNLSLGFNSCTRNDNTAWHASKVAEFVAPPLPPVTISNTINSKAVFRASIKPMLSFGLVRDTYLGFSIISTLSWRTFFLFLIRPGNIVTLFVNGSSVGSTSNVQQPSWVSSVLSSTHFSDLLKWIKKKV